MLFDWREGGCVGCREIFPEFSIIRRDSAVSGKVSPIPYRNSLMSIKAN
jgi:hypothetical protein